MQTISQTEFNQWVDDYSEDLYLFALRYLDDCDAAKDAVQDSFLAALQNFQHFQGKAQVKTWLKSILRNKCMDQLRRKYRTAQHEESYDTTLEDFCFDEKGNWQSRAVPQCDWTPLFKRDQDLMHSFLESCLQLLPEKWYKALKLQYLIEEMAEAKAERRELGLSDANFWQILRRAKLQMRSCLERNGLEKGALP